MNNLQPFEKLPKKFYTRELLTVARELLGKILVKIEDDKLLAGKIVEVEAYDGLTDEAAHTFIGRTKRNEIMFNEGGYLYVYFTYGAHFCCNIVTGKKDHGTAVVIRAVEPERGMAKMSSTRYNKLIITEKEKYNRTSGPGKVCDAFNITKEHYGIDLTGDQIFLLDRPKLKKNDIEVSKRVGIKKSIDLPWRFYIKNNPYISRK